MRYWTILLGLAAFAAHAQSTEPLVQRGNVIYLGAFRVPEGNSPQTSFDYGGTALTYNAAHNSLYLVGHDWYQRTAEISIPQLVASAQISQLATATFLQPFADALEGHLSSVNPASPNSKKIGGELVYDDKLIVSDYSFYDANGTQSTSHFSRPVDLSVTGQLVGPIRVGSLYPGFVDGYMAAVPQEWQALLGGPVLTGNCCGNIISVQSNGPAVSTFDPATLTAGVSQVASTQLLGYPYPRELGPGRTTQNPYFNLTTRISGVVFPMGTRSVLFFGRQGVGPYCYGIGTSAQPLPSGPYCYDPGNSAKGTHAYPYTYQVWAYDANDLAAVKSGRKLAYQLTPYSIWTFTLPTPDPTGQDLLGGVGYDPQSGRIYLSQRCADASCAPIIHVLKIDASAPIPAPPTSVLVR